MTQNQVILAYLKDVNDWIPAYRLRGLNTSFGFTGHQSDRRARELATKGLIEHRINGKFAEYRSKVEQPTQVKLC